MDWFLKVEDADGKLVWVNLNSVAYIRGTPKGQARIVFNSRTEKGAPLTLMVNSAPEVMLAQKAGILEQKT